MATREELEEALREVQRAGSLTIVFDDEAEAYGERLGFYKFLAGVKKDSAHPLCMFAHGVRVQWKRDPRLEFEKLGKRVLVISGIDARGPSKWAVRDNSAAAVEELNEKEEMLKRAREEIAEALKVGKIK